MSGDWKPGDVALVQKKDGTETPHIFNNSHVWCDEYGGRSDARVLGVRPLVVIDPEDAEQVSRFSDAMDAVFERLHPAEFQAAPTLGEEDDTELMQAVFREFATPTPPRPDEPRGLGAVVEDAEGRRFVHRCVCGAPSDWWASGAVSGSRGLRWSDFDAVRVLSEGVTS